MPCLFPELHLTHILDWNHQRQKNPTGVASALKRCHSTQHLDSQENNSSSGWKCLVLPPSRGNSIVLTLQLSLPKWRCKGCKRRGFSSPSCPRRVRTHTSVIYHHASSACQPDKDFSPGVSKLEMLFRLPKQLHVFCFPSQRRAASMQMKGCETCQGCTSIRPGRAPRDGGRALGQTHCQQGSTLTAAPCSSQKAISFGLCISHRLFSSFLFFPFPLIP